MATPITPQPQTPAPGPNVQFANDAVKIHAEVTQKAPAVMGDAINSGNQDTVSGIAATQTIAPYAQAVQDHLNDHSSHSVWANILGDAKGVLSTVIHGAEKVPGVTSIMQWAAKPLQEIQKDYRFIHAVYTDHSPWQGVLATLGVIGGGAAGFVGSGFNPLGAIAGADFAMAAEGELGKIIPNFKDAAKKASDPNYMVSAGRDFSNLLGQVPGFGALKDTQHGFGQTLSGVTDAVFDFNLDPLAKAGSINNALRSGKFVGAAVDDAGKVITDAKGMPTQLKATLPIAAQSNSINQFLISMSGKAINAGQVALAYANPLNGSLRRAVNTIAEISDPVEIMRLFPSSQFTIYEAERLAKAATPEAVVNEMSKSLYSKELVDADHVPRNTLILPTQTVARAFVDKGLKAIRQQGTSINEERNLLLPKTTTVLDESGNPVLNADGSIKKQILQGGLPAALGKLGKLDLTGANQAVLNSLAGKVRTFTGYKSLVINAKTLELNSKNFDWHDPNLAPQIANMALYSMPYDLALEHTAKIMLESDLATKQEMYGNLVKETVKNAGLGANNAIVTKVMSQAQRATDGGELQNINYGPDHKGAPRGYVQMKDGGVQGVALWSWQRGGNAFIDFKELRKAMRESTLHGLLYQKADDFFTYYTDKIFAPLTLFSTGFGLRVASSEALHQIIRTGLGDYLQSQVAQSAAKYNILHKIDNNTIQRYADSAAQALTEEDHNALLTGNKVTDNAITKLIKEKADVYKSLSGTERVNELATDIRNARNKIAPVGFVTSKIAPYLAKDKLDVITKYQQLMGGVGIPAGIASDHGSSFATNASERVDILAQLQGHTAKPTEELASLTGTNPNYHKYLALNLSKSRNEAMARDIAKDWQMFSKQPGWNQLSNDEKWGRVYNSFQRRIEDVNQYADIRPTMVGMSKGDPASFANEVVSSFRGMVEGASGKIHENLINNIRNGERTYESYLKEIPTTDLPYAVLGKQHKPAWDKPYQRLLDLGYRTFVNPIIDHISREPIFAHYLYENYRELKPMLDAKLIDEDTALRLAGQKATVAMVPMIHNPALRSQWATMSRNIMPFYFAQEQAMKRVGRLAFQDGRLLKTFRDFQIINHGINNPGFVHQDATGNKYIVYPLIGEWGNAMARAAGALGLNQYSGMPTSVTGNMSSLMTVLPELKVPGTNPVANIVLTDMGKRFPWMEKASNIATGGYPANNWLDTIIPNSGVRDIFNSLLGDQRENAVHNATLNAMAAAHFHGLIDDNFPNLPPAQQQQIIDKIEANAKTNLFIQGIFSFFLPLAPSVQSLDFNKELKSLRSEFQDRVAAEIAKGNLNAFATAKDAFLAEHGNQAISYTVGFTKTKENGASVPISNSTMNWLNNHQDIMKSNPNGAAYLIPQNTQGGDIQQIENKLLTMELRSKQTPQEFMDSVYIQKGWVDLNPIFTAYQSMLTDAKKTNNISQISQLSQAWKSVSTTYGLSNPIWYNSYKDPTKPLDAQNALKDLQKIQELGKLGTSAQGTGISQLLGLYEYYHAALQQETKQGGKLTAAGYNMIDAWNALLDAQKQQDPNLSNVIDGVFRRVA